MKRFYIAGLGLLAGLLFSTIVQAAEPPVTFPKGWKVSKEIDKDGDPSWSAEPKQGKYDITSIDVDLLTGEVQGNRFRLTSAKLVDV